MCWIKIKNKNHKCLYNSIPCIFVGSIPIYFSVQGSQEKRTPLGKRGMKCDPPSSLVLVAKFDYKWVQFSRLPPSLAFLSSPTFIKLRDMTCDFLGQLRSKKGQLNDSYLGHGLFSQTRCRDLLPLSFSMYCLHVDIDLSLINIITRMILSSQYQYLFCSIFS